MIDAYKMKENCRITGELMNHFECVSLATLGEVIDAQQTIEPVKQGWISVKDRLPEDYLSEGSKVKMIKVFVAIKSKNKYTIRSQTRAKILKNYDSKEYCWEWGKFSYGEVTHGTPLPEPPKEGV